jgi:translation initiation factor 4A
MASSVIKGEKKDLENNDLENKDLECYDSFEDMGLKMNLLRGIIGFGFESPSAIQKKAIMALVKGNDLIAQAQSGTGKTATFLIAVLEIMEEDKDCIQSVILAPTRELAQQIHTIVENIGKYLKFRYKLLIGGSYRKKDIDDINYNKPQCIIGTPGRINDLMNDRQCNFNLEFCKCLIMDEADELLSETFENQIRNVISRISEETQIGLYSATMPPDKMSIANDFMRNPVFVEVKKEELTLEGIRQFHINVEKDEWKYEVLTDLYSSIVIYQLIIYCNSKKRVDQLEYKLSKDGYACSFMHSELSSTERSETMKMFRNGTNRILITTDLLARGIDIQQVSLIINYDIPYNMENYLHRIGRSGRFGRKGMALNFVSQNEVSQLSTIESYYQTQISEFPTNFAELFV